jgi:putative endonuclease
MNPCVYIVTNKPNGTLYVGMTAYPRNRIISHKNKKYPNAFSARYNLDKLVYYEFYKDINDAYAREKQLKGGSRAKKVALIEGFNPTWNDLFDQLP